MIINSRELAERTGATFRQLDYWCTRGIIHPLWGDNPGSGRRRSFNEAIVDRVLLLVRISRAFQRENIPMHQAFDRYDEGDLDLGEGLTLSWDTVEIERARRGLRKGDDDGG